MRACVSLMLLLSAVALCIGPAAPARADTIYVDWSGGGEYTTIQDGLDAAGIGDTVLVAAGIYSTGTGESFPILMKSDVTLRGEYGPGATVIDAEFSGGTVMLCYDLSSDTQIDPLITNVIFKENLAYVGGGVYAYGPSRLSHCTFSGNSSVESGGGLHADTYGADLEYCVFEGNWTDGVGGGIYMGFWPPRGAGTRAVPSHLTFSGNGAGIGGAVMALSGSGSVTAENWIIAFSTSGEPFSCGWSTSVNLECSDVYGNAGGDYVGCIEGQNGTNGNFSEDPFFCDQTGGDFTLHADSPCAEENNPGCGQVGALGVDCPAASIDDLLDTSWGGIKGMWR